MERPRRRLLRLLSGVAIGSVAGLLIFVVTRTTGPMLFVVTGAVAGAGTALVLQAYGRAAELTEVKISVPHFSQLTFMVSNDSRQVAWRLFVEASTRVSTQALDEGGGLLREAMNSLYSLFSTTRETLKEAQPSRAAQGPTVEYLAVAMLNRELRPFLTKWHPRLRAFETARPDSPERDWDEAGACRQELHEVQARLRDYVLGFARLAGVVDPEAILTAGDRSASGPTDRA